MDNSIFESINSILSSVNLDEVSAESSGRDELPDGYYNCEVEKAELTTSKTSGLPMVAFQFKVVEPGIDVTVNENDGTLIKTEIDHSVNRKIFLYYVLKDEKSVKRFASDMLKFEGDTAGEPLLTKECFTTAEVIVDALEVLVGMRIFIQVSTTKGRDGKDQTWKNLVSWKRVSALEL